MKSFSGKALFLDKSDINTDEIIPAKYLTESSKQGLAPYLLEDLQIDGFDPVKDIADKAVIISRDNFGCGSSREHAPWALEVNDINVVIASGFARIFRQNMYNNGMMAIDLNADQIDDLFSKYAGKEVLVTVEPETAAISIKADGNEEIINFTLGGFDAALVQAGGWVEYADKNY